MSLNKNFDCRNIGKMSRILDFLKKYKLPEKTGIFTLDFETGGLKHYQDAFMSFTIKEYLTNWVKTYFFTPQQTKIYNLGALEVNGLDFDFLSKNGIKKGDFVNELDMLFKDFEVIVLIGHNINGFDIKWLIQAYRESNKLGLLPPILTIDTKEEAQYLKKQERLESLKLVNLFEFFIVEGVISVDRKYLLKDAHNSEPDVLMTEDVLDAILQEKENKKDVVLEKEED